MTQTPQSRSTNPKSEATTEVSASLLSLLVCPIDHGKLEVKSAGLTCVDCQRTYPVVNGIPNFVIDE